jgi:hypothetical protein
MKVAAAPIEQESPVLASIEAEHGSEPVPLPAARVRTYMRTIGPEEAAQMLADWAFPEQRILRPAVVSYYADEMEAGRFDDSSTLRLAWFGVRYFLIDGQHRLNAVVRTKLAWSFTITEIACESMEEVRQAFIRTDIGLKRTIHDAVRMAHLDEELGTSAHNAKCVMSGMSLLLSRNARSGAHREDLLLAAREWKPEIKAYLAAAEHPSMLLKGRLVASPVLFVGLITVRFQREKAVEFWSAVAQNSGLVKDQPEAKLVEFLGSVIRIETRDDDIIRRIAVCWNAAYEKKTISRIQVGNPKRSIELRGTPLNGEREYSYDLLKPKK